MELDRRFTPRATVLKAWRWCRRAAIVQNGSRSRHRPRRLVDDTLDASDINRSRRKHQARPVPPGNGESRRRSLPELLSAGRHAVPGATRRPPHHRQLRPHHMGTRPDRCHVVRSGAASSTTDTSDQRHSGIIRAGQRSRKKPPPFPSSSQETPRSASSARCTRTARRSALAKRSDAISRTAPRWPPDGVAARSPLADRADLPIVEVRSIPTRAVIRDVPSSARAAGTRKPSLESRSGALRQDLASIVRGVRDAGVS
jgi:hypothetical protein